MCRFLKFKGNVQNHRKFSLRFLYRVQSQNKQTVVGRNLSMISSRLGNDSIDDIQYVRRNWVYWNLSLQEESQSIGASEAMMVRQQILTVPGFNQEEIMEIFDLLCTT